MKVAVLSRSVPAHGLGGMERHTHLLARELVRLGHEVSVLTTAHPPGTPCAAHIDGVEYTFLAGTEPGKYSRKWWTESRRAFRTMQPELVHSQSIGAYGILGDLEKRGLPLVATSHGTPLSDASTGLRTHGMRLNPAHLLSTVFRLPGHLRVYGKAKRVIAVSPGIAAHLSRNALAPRSRIRVVRNGVDTDFFSPVGERGAASGDKGTARDHDEEGAGMHQHRGPVIFSMARVVQEKGFQFLVSAMPAILKEHPHTHLMIGGEGPYRPELWRLARREGVGPAVEFTRRIPEEKLPACYRACDLFAPATTHVEGLPLVLPEALACGKPIAASRIGGVPDVIMEGKTGQMFTPGDQREVTSVLLEMLSDTRRLKRMGQRARADAEERFGARRMAAETVKVFEEALRS